MKINEFDECMTMLKEVYGEKYYPDARIRILWENLSEINFEVFKRAIKKILVSERFPPMLEDISKYVSDDFKLNENNSAYSNNFGCYVCSDNGFFYVHSKNGSSSIAACSCQKGKYLSTREILPIIPLHLAETKGYFRKKYEH